MATPQIAVRIADLRAARASRLLIAAVAVLALALIAPMAPTAARAAEAAPSPEQAVVAVSLATVWTTAHAPRAIDARALSAPSDPTGWLRRIGTAGRKGLNGRVETQVLMGQRVVILERRGAWAKVAVPGQPSPKSPSGYPGWMPLSQLRVPAGSASSPPVAAGASKEAVVTRPTAWAYADRQRRVRVLKLSYGTRLPVLARSPRAVSVQAPDGRILWLPAKRVSVVSPGAPARAATPKAVVTQAARFLGLPYLWGGTSGFGLDCSGLTHLVYSQLGVTIPRDATPQFRSGKPIPRRSDLRRGDLVFFRDRSGAIHHVGIYTGKGRMIHAPRTGRPVQYSSIATGLWAREFAGGRRFL